MLLEFPVNTLAVAAPPAEATKSPPVKTVSATQPAEAAKPKPPAETLAETPPLAPDPFVLPAEHHRWARFLPGAWCELQTVTETFDETGKLVSRNNTAQKEILQQVEKEKYALKVQATVELSGKRIVGDWKIRVLSLATDGAGQVAGSRRREDRTLQLAGRAVTCQVFEIPYRDGARNLRDRIHYDPQRFPFVLLRETFVDSGKEKQLLKVSAAKASPPEVATAKIVQQTEVLALEIPYLVGRELLDCSWLRTVRHRAKGNTVKLMMLNKTVPGGKVAVWSSDFDAQGQRVRWSGTTLLAYGETSPEETQKP